VGADAEEFRPKRWAGGEDGLAVVGSNYGFLTSLVGPRGVLRMSTGVEFKCLLVVTIGGFELEQHREREVV